MKPDSDPPVLISTLLLAQLAASAPLALPESPFLEGAIVLEQGTIPYRLLPPAEVVEEELYPLVLFLHGAGERGDDNEAQLAHFPERMASEAYRERFPCFVLAPQCPQAEFWSHVSWSGDMVGTFGEQPTWPMQGAIAALKEVLASQPIDRERIYLTGLSMGGFGTWDLAMRHPDWFAAAAPICGGGDESMVHRVAGLPLFVWHGVDDEIVDLDYSGRMVRELETLGATPHFFELEGVGHNAWIAGYGEEGCIDALFACERDPQAELLAAARILGAALEPEERVAFLGDSITEAGDAPGGYVDGLRALLRVTQPGVEVIPAGISGHRVPDLLARFQADVVEQRATLVFVYIGINDVWHSLDEKGTPAEEYEAGLRKLVIDLRASGATVVLATPSTIGELPRGQNPLDAMLDEYAAISRRVAAEEGATLCDLRAAFEDHLAVFLVPAQDRDVLTTDGVHLNAAGNVFVATQAARALTAAARARARARAQAEPESEDK